MSTWCLGETTIFIMSQGSLFIARDGHIYLWSEAKVFFQIPRPFNKQAAWCLSGKEVTQVFGEGSHII